MKKCVFALLFLTSLLAYSQNNRIVKTEDGRRVLLKADFTWEYIDSQPLTLVDSSKIKPVQPLDTKLCNTPKDFKEPKLDSKIQAQLKKGRATISHIKKKVAKDYKCDVKDVILISASERKASGNYTFCANGKKVFYKRSGHNVAEKRKLF
ncbi:DUF3157 family protein [Hyunsoonleella flava]|uniref:DUF3157 family protein n=1 Tax=Hyunsoonleella flava TaxID=2527939 RepID=A0A4Q9FD59_9FLAO|nr:DUF3157 family protein [Hyunsoonleella flava]TBN03920.1 DUF3157 family protein [Hyunsoonleella flava]